MPSFYRPPTKKKLREKIDKFFRLLDNHPEHFTYIVNTEYEKIIEVDAAGADLLAHECASLAWMAAGSGMFAAYPFEADHYCILFRDEELDQKAVPTLAPDYLRLPQLPYLINLTPEDFFKWCRLIAKSKTAGSRGDSISLIQDGNTNLTNIDFLFKLIKTNYTINPSLVGSTWLPKSIISTISTLSATKTNQLSAIQYICSHMMPAIDYEFLPTDCCIDLEIDLPQLDETYSYRRRKGVPTSQEGPEGLPTRCDNEKFPLPRYNTGDRRLDQSSIKAAIDNYHHGNKDMFPKSTLDYEFGAHAPYALAYADKDTYKGRPVKDEPEKWKSQYGRAADGQTLYAFGKKDGKDPGRQVTTGWRSSVR